MSIYSLIYEKKQGLVRIDPRTKIFLLILGNIAVILAPSLSFEIYLVMGYVVFGFLCGIYGYPIKLAALYYLLVIFQFVSIQYLTGVLGIMLITFAQFVCMILPCALLAGIMIATVRANEFMAALNKLHVSKNIVIPLTVMIRYFPMVVEDLKHIKDAMRMRDITPSFLGFLKAPLLTIECVYVPLMMSASKVADELSAAVVTRGIENPLPRTCMAKMGLGWLDYICVLFLVTVIVAECLLKGGVLFG